MDKFIFSKNLNETILEIIRYGKLNQGEYFLKISPVPEPGKPLLTEDEIMRLNILNKNRVEGKLFSFDEAVQVLAFFSPLVPVWINVQYIGNIQEKMVFQLNCSQRLRKPSQLGNQETGHPPFKAIYT